ncbi:hypothetical protein BDN70DRAFT_917625 [Pholiota conissans]|uniref:Uncharacterized protein n=1 Tax=Pholiota conissans TaxID=109636 RepID=A0A9P6D5Y5_9AGAR|nr:hypothetical protein BDN70DRAFT_917625 [Pholiota conissans]
MADQNATPEMGKYLRQIVDNALEEGQFESAIAMLDQLRSPDHKPSIIHILHLLFISLHSYSHDIRLDDAGTDPVDPVALLLQSPRKIVKQSKSALILSPKAVLAAQNLLFAFISTNLPQDIAAALPHYPDTEARRQVSIGGDEGAQFAFDYLDSPIYNQSAAIRNARSVWELLKAGYVTRAMQVFGTPKVRKGKASTRSLGRDSSFNLSTEVEIDVVGDDSWALLEWLVTLFEKDEEIARSQGLQKHSPLLLRQLPPPPLNTTTRWDASEPLKIVAFAIQQSDRRRQRFGLRLLNLLIDLSQTTPSYLNPSSLASTALAQFASSTGTSSQICPHNFSKTPPQDLSHHGGHPPRLLIKLFTLLSNTSMHLTFKILLCQKILQDLDENITSAPRPAPRPSSHSSSNKGDEINPFAVKPISDKPPLVSALKRPTPTPRILPRPRTSVTVSTSPPDANGAASPQVVLSEKPGEAEKQDPAIIIRGGAKATPGDATPLIPVIMSPPPQPLLPFDDISQLVKVQAKNEAPHANGRSRTAHATQAHRTAVQCPRTARSPELLRVRYELLLACVLLMARARSELEAEKSELESRPDVLDWTQSLSDGRMHELILVVFGPQTSCSDEEEAADKAFYGDAIRAAVGFPNDTT